MSAQREIFALWSRCAELRRRMTGSGTGLDAPLERMLDGLIGELTSATRRLETAGMLTPSRTRHLHEADLALTAARTLRLPASAAIARCMDVLELVAASFRIALPATPPPPPYTPSAASPSAFDYDTRPDRFRIALEVTRRYSTREDIHGQVAARLAAEGAVPVVDAGCGTGRLLRLLVDA
ncbi:MAG: hypothetical protein ACREQ5_23280, partial [Candidatus Dormibacteria bacterium]